MVVQDALLLVGLFLTTSVIGSLDRMATPLYVFCPLNTT